MKNNDWLPNAAPFRLSATSPSSPIKYIYNKNLRPSSTHWQSLHHQRLRQQYPCEPRPDSKYKNASLVRGLALPTTNSRLYIRVGDFRSSMSYISNNTVACADTQLYRHLGKELELLFEFGQHWFGYWTTNEKTNIDIYQDFNLVAFFD